MKKLDRSVCFSALLACASVCAPPIAAAEDKPQMAKTAKDFSSALRLRGPKAVVADPQPSAPKTETWSSSTSSSTSSSANSSSANVAAASQAASSNASASAASSSSVAAQSYQTLISSRPRAASLIHFNTNSAKLKGDAYRILDELASALSSDLSDAVLMIVGHTDSQGASSYNMQLSRQRAQSVRSYLIAQGIDGSRLVAKGYGEAHPIERNNTSNGRALNRRSEFIRID